MNLLFQNKIPVRFRYGIPFFRHNLCNLMDPDSIENFSTHFYSNIKSICDRKKLNSSLKIIEIKIIKKLSELILFFD
jgi:hypothetical protein